MDLIPVINKIDLPAAEPERVKEEIENVIGLPADDAVLTSAKINLGIEELLEAIVARIPAPAAEPERVKEEIENVIGLPADDAVLTSAKINLGIEELLEAIVARIPAPNYDEEAPLRALIFDSKFDDYRGVITYVKVEDGSIKKGDKIKIWSTGREAEILECGIFSPNMKATGELTSGSVGYIITGLKTIKDSRVGDTITHVGRPCDEPLQGFRPAQSMVFAGIYPISTDDYGALRESLEKLQLNDASLNFVPETSQQEERQKFLNAEFSLQI